MNDGNTQIKRGGKRQGAGRKRLPPDQKRVPLTIKLSRKNFDRLTFLAKASGQSKTGVIERVIEYLKLSNGIKRRGPRRSKLPAGEIIDV
jgi:hypothetical protein